ncbi:chlorohydrolase [Streptococcus pneumoniae]|nr:chlorohydrolase [Streptococcus pneumoniae]
MKIKGQTRKLAAGCSKQCFEVAGRTDEVSNIYTVRSQSQIRLTKSGTHIYGKATLTRFEEIFEEYKTPGFSYS